MSAGRTAGFPRRSPKGKPIKIFVGQGHFVKTVGIVFFIEFGPSNTVKYITGNNYYRKRKKRQTFKGFNIHIFSFKGQTEYPIQSLYPTIRKKMPSFFLIIPTSMIIPTSNRGMSEKYKK
jgi:hypothetical protein